MNSRVLTSIGVLFLNSLNALSSDEPSMTLWNNELIDIRLERDSTGIGLWVVNITGDSLVLRSSFHIDNPSKLSFILVYYCYKRVETLNDSIICNFGYATGKHSSSILVEFNNRKTIIKPYAKIFLPFGFPIKEGAAMYVKVQFVIIRSGVAIFVTTQSNSMGF